MKKWYSGFLPGIFVLICVLPVSVAQAANGTVDIECISFPKLKGDAILPRIEVLVGEEETEVIELPSHTLSERLTIPRLDVWKFGKSGRDAEGNFTFTTYAAVQPNDARRQLIIFIQKGPEPEAGYRVVVLDGSEKNFGEKKLMFMNLADLDVEGEVGGRDFRLPSEGYLIMEQRVNRDPNLCYTNLRYKRDGKARSFLSTNWPLLKNSRGLVFFYPDPRTTRKRVRMHSVVDSLLEFKDPPNG